MKRDPLNLRENDGNKSMMFDHVIGYYRRE